MKNYGWVSPQILGNFAAWSNWQETGTEQDAQLFWEQTRDEAEAQGLEFFCVDAD